MVQEIFDCQGFLTRRRDWGPAFYLYTGKEDDPANDK